VNEERLAEIRERCENTNPFDGFYGSAHQDITDLLADVVRLRAALTRIADEPGPDADDPIVFEYFARNVAKRALEVGK